MSPTELQEIREQYGITQTQEIVLDLVRQTPHDNFGDLVMTLTRDKKVGCLSNIYRQIYQLSEKEFLSIDPVADKKRNKVVRLTKKGEELLSNYDC
jgi:DNA-binding MarR family transcriptional regulator